MSTLGDHLSQQDLSEEAKKVLKDLEEFLKSAEFKQQKNNLYYCYDQTELEKYVKLLIPELPFITTKVQ
jgi:hypothetical protein